MPITEALMIAVSGFLVVFIMLVILWGIIVGVSKVVNAVETKTEPVKAPTPAAQTETASETEEAPAKQREIYGGEIALYNVDEKTAACIMAIVSDSSGIPLDHLIFKSIKALD